LNKIGRTLAAAGAGLTLMASAAQAQVLGTGSGCSGDKFLFCASWSLTYIDATHISLQINNTSQNAPASNTNSVFTQIGIGNVTWADPASMTPVVGWQYDSGLNGFNGFGLLENQFGTITTNGVNTGLTDGSGLLFSFTFGSSIGTFAQAQTASSGFQIAIHDQGNPAGGGGCSSKGVLVGATSGQNTASNPLEGCGGGSTSTVPEPSTYALMAAGLAGLFVASRRRRSV